MGFTPLPGDIAEIVRPWFPVFSPSKPRPIPPVEEVHGEAFTECGGPSDFLTENSFRDLAKNLSFKVKDEDPGPVPEFNYTEQGRNVSVVRITNPEDETQFVDVERINAIKFNGPGGQVFSFSFSNS